MEAQVTQKADKIASDEAVLSRLRQAMQSKDVELRNAQAEVARLQETVEQKEKDKRWWADQAVKLKAQLEKKTSDDFLSGASPKQAAPAASKASAMELIKAAVDGDLDKVRTLCEFGVVLNHMDANGNTALLIACEHGRLEVARHLCTSGAAIEKTMQKDKLPCMSQL